MNTVFIKKIAAAAITCVTLVSGMAFSSPVAARTEITGIKPGTDLIECQCQCGGYHECGRYRDTRILEQRMIYGYTVNNGKQMCIVYERKKAICCQVCGKVFQTYTCIEKEYADILYY